MPASWGTFYLNESQSMEWKMGTVLLQMRASLEQLASKSGAAMMGPWKKKQLLQFLLVLENKVGFWLLWDLVLGGMEVGVSIQPCLQLYGDEREHSTYSFTTNPLLNWSLHTPYCPLLPLFLLTCHFISWRSHSWLTSVKPPLTL